MFDELRIAQSPSDRPENRLFQIQLYHLKILAYFKYQQKFEKVWSRGCTHRSGWNPRPWKETSPATRQSSESAASIHNISHWSEKKRELWIAKRTCSTWDTPRWGRADAAKDRQPIPEAIRANWSSIQAPIPLKRRRGTRRGSLQPSDVGRATAAGRGRENLRGRALRRSEGGGATEAM